MRTLDSSRSSETSFVVDTSLSAADFDVSSFLAALSSSSSPPLALPAVRDRLATYHATLSAKLLAHVNRDYDKFVQLTTQIEGVDTMIDELNDSFGGVEAKALAARAQVGAPLPGLDAMLEQRRALRGRRRHLEALVGVHGAVARCERALEELAAAAADSDEAEGGENPAGAAAAAALERVAVRVAHADVALAQLRDAPLAATLRPRLDDARAATLRRLQRALAAQLTAQTGNAPAASAEARLRCTVRAHLVLGERELVEAALADLVVRPFLADHLTRGRLDGGGGRNSCAGLPAMFNAVLDFVERRCGVAIRVGHELAESGSTAGGGIDLLGSCVVATTLEAVAARLPGIFRPGKSDTFHSNFMASMRLLREIERRFCRTEAQRVALRALPAVATFVRLWDLLTYFEVRAARIKSSLDASLAAAAAEGSASSSAAETTKEAEQEQREAAEGKSGVAEESESAALADAAAVAIGLRAAPSKALWFALSECWNPRVSLQPLVPQFAQLSLELVARFATWAGERIVALAQRHAAGTRGDERRAKAAVDEIVLLRADLRALHGGLETELVERARESWVDARTARNVIAPMMEDVAALKILPLIEQCWRQIEASIAAMCSTALLAVKSVPSAFKMGSKPMPTQCSPFVASILKPVASTLRRHESFVPEAQRRPLMERVVAVLLSQYAALVAETLNRVRRTERSLRKLRAKQQKRAKKAAGANEAADAADEVTETDKICRQLLLDARAFGDELRALPHGGIDPTSSVSYQDFLAAVEAQIAAGDAEE